MSAATVAAVARPATFVARVGVYCRISRDKEGAGLGVARQEEECRRLVETMSGAVVVDVYVDNDVSAYGGKVRPNYRRLLADLASGRVDTVVCWHTDRLHRSVRDLLDYAHLTTTHDVRTFSVRAGHFDLTTATGRALAVTMATWACHEVERGIERIRSAKNQSRAAGEWLGGPAPFGFRVIKERDRLNLAVVEDEADLIQRAAESVMSGSSLCSIAAEWNAREGGSPRGRRWASHHVATVLTSPTTAGRVAHAGQDIGVVALWPGILTVDTWEAVRMAGSQEPVRKLRPRSPKRLLSGVATCGRCGAPVKAGVKDSGAAIYRCSATTHLTRLAETVDDIVAARVVDRLSSKDSEHLLTPDRSGELKQLRARLELLRARKVELAEQREDPGSEVFEMDTEEYRAARAKNRGLLAAAEDRLTVLSTGSVLDGIAGQPDAADRWVGFTIEQRRAVIEATARVTILPGKRGGNAGTRNLRQDVEATVKIEWR